VEGGETNSTENGVTKSNEEGKKENETSKVGKTNSTLGKFVNAWPRGEKRTGSRGGLVGSTKGKTFSKMTKDVKVRDCAW